MTELPKNLDTILHIGAGNGEELPQYLKSDARRILLVEPNPNLAEALRQRVQGDDRVQVIERAITDNPALNQLTEYNLLEATSLYQPTGLRQIFPGLRITAQHPVATSTPQQLLEQHALGKGNNLLVLQAPGAELTIIKTLAAIDTCEPFAHLWLTCPHEALYDSSSRASDALAELTRQGYDVIAEGADHDDWPQWQLACNPLTSKVQTLETEKQKLIKRLEGAMQHSSEADETVNQLQEREMELGAALNQANAMVRHLREQVEANAKELQRLKAELDERTNQTGKLKEQLESSQQSQNKTETELEQQTKRLKIVEKENGQLKESLKQLQSQLEASASSQKELGDLKKRMEYLFEQNSLQLEQATNALGRHVSSTAQVTAKELEAGIALQQQYGGDLPDLESGSTRLSSAVALTLSRQLKAKPYDLIIELGGGVTTTFMAHTLRSHNRHEAKSDESSENQVSLYIDPSENDLPKRIVCFEHNRSIYNQRLESLKASSLSPLIGLQLAPLVPYNYKGNEYLYYDCGRRLQHIARIFENRDARILVVINDQVGEKGPDRVPALPQVLRYLSSHSLDVVVHNAPAKSDLIAEWHDLLDRLDTDYRPAKEFGSKTVQLIQVNP